MPGHKVSQQISGEGSDLQVVGVFIYIQPKMQGNIFNILGYKAYGIAMADDYHINNITFPQANLCQYQKKKHDRGSLINFLQVFGQSQCGDGGRGGKSGD